MLPCAVLHVVAVLGGTIDLEHDAVVAIEATATASDGPMFCSGFVIAPRLVVTAAHCVVNRIPDDVSVRVGTDQTTPDVTLAVAAIEIYPRFMLTPEGAREGTDLAVVVLSEDAPVVPLELAADDGALLGRTAIVSGYGRTDVDAPETVGIRHDVEVPITSECDRLVGFGTDDRGACAGDSGGPLIVDGRAVAITSFHATARCAPPAFAVLLQPYRDWIASIVAGAPDRSCDRTCPPQSTSCFAPDPEPEPEPDPDVDAFPETGGCRATATTSGTFYPLLVAVIVMRRRTRDRCGH